MLNRIPASIFWTGLWFVLVAVSLFVRPPLPVDETRYLAVAWDMWLRHDFLVPYLNGEPYSHKPPLLFWLMHLGWAIFGVNDVTPRLVAPLFGLACLFLTRSLARDLWPDDRRVHDMAPLILLGCGFWTLFSTLTMFDLILAFWTLLGLRGVLLAWRQGSVCGFAMLGFAIGLGALTKGPAILLHILPVALLAPLWAGQLVPENLKTAKPLRSWRWWYFGVFLSVVFGVVIGLAWAIPAGIAGGEVYRDAILWGQTAGRMVKSFAHQRPFWWYVAVLPGLLVPWLIWPPLWRALWRLRSSWRADGGLRLGLIWFVAAFFIFSLISGKQLHYLLPEFPALALILAFALCNQVPSGVAFWDRALPAMLAVGLGGFIILVPVLHVIPREPFWLPLLNNQWGALLIAVGLWIFFARFDGVVDQAQIVKIVLVPVTIVVTVHLAAAPVLKAAYDLQPVSQQLKIWQDEGIALANFGKYHGQYQFMGRLTKPMAIVGRKQGDVAAFLARNPNGRVVAYYKTVPTDAKPLVQYHFRSRTIVVWDSKTLQTHPNLRN